MSVDYTSFICFGVPLKQIPDHFGSVDDLDEKLPKGYGYCTSGSAYNGKETTIIVVGDTYQSVDRGGLADVKTMEVPRGAVKLPRILEDLGCEPIGEPRWLLGSHIW